MSLEQVKAFYDLLTSDPTIYDQYSKKCCNQGFFGSYHWDKTKIVKFAATHGYNFNENELDQIWFDSESSSADNSLNLA
ncbi:Nif11 family protein [Tolypothrix sp. FACHB-123]|uniref:Nif11-like leader peptide family natural product precursor n=1 Tax=Tolypothrix sp. FACHB-123 TaxID=2692868 RepID=UPI001689D84A|nr:Nif11-like leader peptide family natural product precursor [Tolypothrix sp. FACHB-123]MBD2355941.1 Nif11 family protein [Tolypothrix sp. FACHB-123]